MATTDLGNLQILTFSLSGELFGVEILRVREIITYESVTRLPGAPKAVRGVINLRGSVVPVVDLGSRFGFGENPVTNRTCVVIVETESDGEKNVMGVIADAVNDVLAFKPDEIENPPGFGTRVGTDCLIGMGKIGKQFVLILDIKRILESISAAVGADSNGTGSQPKPIVEPQERGGAS